MNQRRPAIGLAVATAVAMTAVLGCTGQNDRSSGAPPTVVCGTVLTSGAAGAVVVDAVHDHAVITEPSMQDLLFIEVSADCSHGARVTWEPPQGAALVKEARAEDRLDAAVVLRPATSRTAFTITARRYGASVLHVAVRLGSP